MIWTVETTHVGKSVIQKIIVSNAYHWHFLMYQSCMALHYHYIIQIFKPGRFLLIVGNGYMYTNKLPYHYMFIAQPLWKES